MGQGFWGRCGLGRATQHAGRMGNAQPGLLIRLSPLRFPGLWDALEDLVGHRRSSGWGRTAAREAVGVLARRDEMVWVVASADV